MSTSIAHQSFTQPQIYTHLCGVCIKLHLYSCGQVILYIPHPLAELNSVCLPAGQADRKIVSKVVPATKLLVSDMFHLLKPSVSLKETTGFIAWNCFEVPLGRKLIMNATDRTVCFQCLWHMQISLPKNLRLRKWLWVSEKLLYREYPCSKCGIGPYALGTLV